MKTLSLVLLCAACSSEIVADQGEVTLRPNAAVDPAVLRPGMIAISSEGDGYVRRVLADGTMEPASLFDAVTRARFQHAFTPDEIVAGDEIHQELDVDVNAGIAFFPDVEIGFELDEAGLVSLDLSISGTYAATLDARFAQRMGGGWNNVATHAATPLRMKTVVDGLPIIVVARAVTDFAVYAGGAPELQLASAGEGEAILDTQVHFDRTSGWTITDASLRDIRQKMSGSLPSRDAHGNVDAVATTRFEIGLYDRSGPYVELMAATGVDAASCVALGEGSISAGAGVDANVIAPNSVMHHASLFRQVHPILGDLPCP